MKIVLLPGMDGTGRLFAPLLNQITDHQCMVIALPQSGPQDYPTLANFVHDKLPDDDFILIAESFSGPIAATIAQQNHSSLKGVIFIATFLTPPHVMLLKLAQFLPIKWMSNLPGAHMMQKFLFFNKPVNLKLLILFNEVIDTVPSQVLRDRLKSISLLKTSDFNCVVPSLYVSATEDKLVSADKIKDFQQRFTHLSVQKINGPHFIIQTCPEKCGQMIHNFVKKT